MMLNPNAFAKAEAFLKSQARPLEVARFEYVFNGADVVGILTELKKFQNSDGGFGHGLEPDLRCSESSVLCTSIAFQIMRDHQVSADEEMVQRAIQYLLENLDRDELHWRIISESASSAPHAPWWKQEGREEEFTNFGLNPTAEILGYLLDYGGALANQEVISQVTTRVIETLRSLQTLEMHDLMCCLRLQETKNLPAPTKDVILAELSRLLADAVETNPEQWSGYCLRPLHVIRHPNSPLIEGLQEAVSLNLDYEIKEQSDNGSWSPTWNWGGLHSDTWEIAKCEWSGFLTLDKLVLLDYFGRIERAQHKSQSS